MPFAGVFFWARAQPQLMPTSFVFVTGVAVDVLSYGPLGYWSLIYLSGLALTGPADRFGARGGLSEWIGFTAIGAGLALLAWLVASIYFVHFIAWRPMAWAAVLLALIYPALQALLLPLDRWVAGPRALNLERRMPR